jgi:predicted nucleic acid-binding Zn ribbon protein
MHPHSGPWAEIQDLERLRDWLKALAQGQPTEPAAVDPLRAQRWQDDGKAPGERLSQLFF